MQWQEVSGSKVNTTAGACEREQLPEARQQKKGASFKNTGKEKSVR